MKLHKIFLVAISALILVACGNNIEKGDTENIGTGMSQDQIIEILGEPDYSTTNRDELSNKFYTWYSIHAVEAEDDDNQYDENAAYLSLGDYLEAIEDKVNVEVFEYKIEDELLIHVYFLNNEVNYFYEYELL